MTRPPLLRASFEIRPDELVVDSFAGGGGASTGIEAALRRPVDIAINHSAVALAMHAANHPETKHFCENILDVDPREACGSRPVGLAWFSPDCKHHSRAKGTKPLDKNIRGLAWVVIRWAETVRPRVIILENVEEFAEWGPLGDDDRPIKELRGETFREWRGKLVDLGYHVEHRSLVAADYGAPTTRRRLFLVARCDGLPIVWPEPTHGRGLSRAWRCAHEIIDWSIPCRSIFGRKKPLAEATLRRIAKGLERYVFGNGEPFVIPVTHQGDARVHSIREPMRTITAAHRGEYSLVEPFIVRHGHYSTITGAGLREGCGAGTFRGQPLSDPLATICATNDKHLVCPVITKHFGGPNGHATPGTDVRAPLAAITAKDHHGLTAAFLTKYYGTAVGADARAPVPTITAHAGGGHLGEVRAFLMKYHGGESGSRRSMSLFDPVRTIDTANRFALVMIHGEPYEIVDIGTRMLEPHELFAAQGFPPTYDIRPLFRGKPISKTVQTELVGNSVSPPPATALVAANTRERGEAAA